MTPITQVIQGFETHSFKSNFESWPAGTVTGSGEEGRGKVAGSNLLLTSLITPFPFRGYSSYIWCMLLALLKQQRVDMKGMTKGSPLNEEVPPLLEAGGKLEVVLSPYTESNM